MWGGAGCPARAGPAGTGSSHGVWRVAGPGRCGVRARGQGAPEGMRIGAAGDVRRTCDEDQALHDRRSIPCGLWGRAPTERGSASPAVAVQGARHGTPGPLPAERTVIERAAPGEPGPQKVAVRTRPGRSGRLAFGTPLPMIRERVGSHADARRRHRILAPRSRTVPEPVALADGSRRRGCARRTGRGREADPPRGLAVCTYPPSGVRCTT